MKILQINIVYPRGSTGKIINDIHEELLSRNIESVICYGRGPKLYKENIYRVSTELLSKFNALKSRITGLQYNGSLFATKRLIRIIEKENPDIVHLHNLNQYYVNIYKLMDYLKKTQVKTVITLHSEYMYTGSCALALDCQQWKNSGCSKCPQLWDATKSLFFDRTSEAWNLMKDSFESFGNIRVVSVSPWLGKRARKSLILRDKEHSIVLNGIDTDIFRYREYDSIWKDRYKDKKILLHVTANFSGKTKGGKYIVELAKKLSDENVIILVIGQGGNKKHLPSNIEYIGPIRDQKTLASYYSMADLSIITSKKETFSMVCAESLCCGTPVVGFLSGGPEEISIDEYSQFVEQGDTDALLTVVQDWMDRRTNKGKLSSLASRKFDKGRMTSKYIEIYKTMLAEY